MRLKPKTVRRLTLLAVVLTVILGAAFSLFFVRRWQMGRQFAAYRRDGLAALAAGHYRKSLADLGRYIQRGHRDDADALLAFAQARAALEEPDFSHLRSAIQAYQQYLESRPDAHGQRLELLKLCNQAGEWMTASDAAARLRPVSMSDCGIEHIVVLREEAIALTAGEQNGARLNEVVTRLLELDRLDLQGNLIRLDVWSRTGRGEEALLRAAELVRDYPNDPVARVVAAASNLIRPTLGDERQRTNITRVQLAIALGIDPTTAEVKDPVLYPDPEFVSRITDILDRINAFDISLALLKQWSTQREGPPKGRVETGLLRTLSRRLWQQGQYTDCISLGPVAPLGTGDAEIMAFRALSLQRGDVQDGLVRARAIAEDLGRRTDDFRAAAWAIALPVADNRQNRDALADADALREAIKTSNRIEPVFLVLLGDRYAKVARVDEARQLWSDAASSPICRSWAYPLVRKAESLLAEGRAMEADTAASEALLISHDSPLVNVLWFECKAALIQKGSTPDNSVEILGALDRALVQLNSAPSSVEVRDFRERLLVPRVLLLSRSGDPIGAATFLRELLDSPLPLSVRTLQRLAAVSVSEKFGLEDECLNRAAAANADSPHVAFSRALQLAQFDEAEEGLALVRDAATSETAEARLLLARYMEHIRHPEAARVWMLLGDDFAKDVAVQRACLSAGSIGGEREFVERTVARYQQLSGLSSTADDPAVMTANARVLLTGAPSKKDRDTAVAMLARVVGSNPALVEPKVLLARALLMPDSKSVTSADEPRAIALLEEARTLEPRSTDITLELARVYAGRQDRARASELLIALGQDSTADPASRRAAVRMLKDSGTQAAAAAAMGVLQSIVDDVSNGGREAWPGLLVDLAKARQEAKQDDAAARAFERAIAGRRVTSEQVFAAASFAQRAGRAELLKQSLDRLEAVEPTAGARLAILARLADDRGDHAAAVKLFEEAVTANPNAVEGWRAYIASQLAWPRNEDAIEVAARAVKALPNEPSLKVTLEQARVEAASNESEINLAPLIAALSADPAQTGAADILRALDEAQQRGDLDRPERVMELAEKFPAVPLLHVYLARRVAHLDPDRAAQLVQKARVQAPVDRRIAKGATDVFRSLERWSEVLASAAVWRELSPGPEPDVAIAEARLHLHDYRGGLAALKGWIEEASANPEAPHALAVLNMQARLLIGGGSEVKARSLLEPLLPTSAKVRARIWLPCAGEAVPSLGEANEWIASVRPHIPIEATGEQLAVAAAWSKLADRFPAEATATLAQARAHLEGVTARLATGTAEAWEALGVVCHRTGDLVAAEQCYERSLAMDARLVTSLNNLANLLAEHRKDPVAALSVARRAVDVRADETTLWTLGNVQLALADAEPEAQGASAAFREAAQTFTRLAERRPGDARPRSRAAQAWFDAGSFAESAAAWEQVAVIPDLKPENVAVAKNNQANAIVRHASREGEPVSREQVDRARDLVKWAIKEGDLPAFHDTLGWVELAAGRRGEAVAAFRKAMGTESPKSESPRIGLALALAGGSEEERREAARLAASVEAKGLDSYLAQKLRSLLSLVQVEKAEPGR